MKKILFLTSLTAALVLAVAYGNIQNPNTNLPPARDSGVVANRIPNNASTKVAAIHDPFVQPCTANQELGFQGHGTGQPQKLMTAVDSSCRTPDTEPGWRDARLIPWEAFAFGEYIGPHRTPHVPEYRLRVDDQLEFVYMRNRRATGQPYRLFVGDIIEISGSEPELKQTNITILSDGTISLDMIGLVRAAGKTIGDLQDELNERYRKFFKNPTIIVRPTKSDTPQGDLQDAVDARAGQGGQSRSASVSPDGTVQLPLVGPIPAVGLTLKEIQRETNARYGELLTGFNVTPILIQRAPRFVYVVGEVGTPGRFDLTGPTSVMQALALAGGANAGGNLRQVIVFRRDQNWRLSATKLDMAGALYGKRPQPSDEIWLRDSDILLVPKKPIQRLSEAVDQYLQQTLYAAVPREIIFNFDGFAFLN